MLNETQPVTAKGWIKLAKNHKIMEKSVAAKVKINSGSKMAFRQFLLLRALWGATKTASDCQTLCDGDKSPLTIKARKEVKEFLNKSIPWGVYRASFERNFRKKPPASGRQEGENEKEAEGAFDIVTSLHKYLYDNSIPQTDETLRRQTRSMTNPMRSSSSKQVASDSSKEKSASNSSSKSHEDDINDAIQNMSQLELGADDAGGIIEHFVTRKENPLDKTPLISPKSPLVYDSTIRETRKLEDEELAVFGLINFLHALIMHCKLAKGRWLPVHSSFMLQIRGTEKPYKSKVDGIWRISESQHVGIIAEAKRDVRHKKANVPRVSYQETAEMAAWILDCHGMEESCDKDKEYGKLLISIDQNEIYVVIGTYTSKYVDYLRGAPDPEDFLTATDGFLFMQPYGPFDIFDGLNMYILAKIMLGFSIQNGVFYGNPDKR